MTAISKYAKFRPPVVAVQVPEWDNETVHLKGMDARAMEAFFDIPPAEDEEKYSAIRAARIVVLHMCDENGDPLVSESEREEAAQELSGHQFSAVSLLLTESMRASGLSQEAIEESAGN